MQLMDTQYIIPTQAEEASSYSSERIQISVNVHANVIVADKAKKAANVWLLMQAGNLLRADNPELLLADTLLWRFDVSLSVPNLAISGTGEVHRVGKIHVDAHSGKVLSTNTLIDELKANADALTAS